MFIRLLLVLVLISQSVFADDREAGHDGNDNGDYRVEYPATSDPSLSSKPTVDDKALDNLESVAPSIYEANKKWAEELEGLSEPLLKMRAKVFELADKFDSTIGIDETNERIGNGKISITGDEIGKKDFGTMKLTICNGVRIAVFFLNGTGRAIEIYEQGEIDTESKQFKEMEAGFHVWGNDEIGRDVTRMELHSDKSPQFTHNDRAQSVFQRKWWADQFHAKIRKPDRDGIIMNIFTGVLLQGGISALITGGTYALLAALGLPHHFDIAPMLVAASFGGVLGIFGETYNNIAYRGKFMALKQLPVTVGFTAAMMYATGQGEHFWSIRFLATTAVAVVAQKTLFSNPWRKPINLKTDLRELSGKWRFTVLGTEHNWDRKMYYRNMLYLIPFVFKNLDYNLRGFETLPYVKTLIAHSAFIHHSPILVQALQVGIPYFQILGLIALGYFYIRYLKSLNARPVVEGQWTAANAEKVKKELEVEESNWNHFWRIQDYPKHVVSFAKEAPGKISNYCSNLMGRLRSRVEAKK